MRSPSSSSYICNLLSISQNATSTYVLCNCIRRFLSRPSLQLLQRRSSCSPFAAALAASLRCVSEAFRAIAALALALQSASPASQIATSLASSAVVSKHALAPKRVSPRTLALQQQPTLQTSRCCIEVRLQTATRSYRARANSSSSVASISSRPAAFEHLVASRPVLAPRQPSLVTGALLSSACRYSIAARFIIFQQLTDRLGTSCSHR